MFESRESRVERRRNPQSRRGISLTEVLIAMGIMTVGLLGVAAVFPVGGWYMQRAEISDRGSAIAQSVMSDLVARGMLNPKSWYISIPWTRNAAANAWNTGFVSDGRYMPAPYNVSPPPATFGRPLAEAISDALTQSNAATDKTLLSKQFGSAYIIDPIGASILAYPGVPGQANRNGPAVTFPAAAYYASTFTSPSSLYFTSGLWTSWSATPTKSDPGQLWPVRRVTFRGVSTGWQLDPTMAEHYFRASDDLATDLPARDDRPVAQEWDTDKSTGAPLARQWTGDYSWIASVVPTTNAARDGIATNPESFDYDVSVVVFHKRPLPVSAASTTISNLSDYYNAMSENERAVKASILSTSLKGGELRLTDIGDNPAKSPFEGLKTGQWIMLCGPHPNSSDSEPRFFLKWYKVKSIDSEGTGISNFDPSKERIVSVSGPQWPWLPRTSYPASQQNLDSAKISDSLCVAICKGAVAVHTKTLRLEGHSAWSAGWAASGNSGGSGGGGGGNGGFGGGGGPGGNPPGGILY